MTNEKKITDLSRANKAMRDKKYAEALDLYHIFLKKYPSFSSLVDINIKMAEAKLGDFKPKVDISNDKEINFNSDYLKKLSRPHWLAQYDYDCIISSGLFDANWYFDTYNKKYNLSTNLLEHYLTEGVKLKLNPSVGFDTAYYIEENQDVSTAGVNPFIHYVTQGITENGRNPLPLQYMPKYEVEQIRYVEREPLDNKIKTSVKVIAFYLPQFHAIPENDLWWGNGFTEWTNVKPAKPQFEGHYQPHIPDFSIGYYDLLDPIVLKKQIDLAKQYGVGGFCFYHYWFTGNKLLERPVDNFLADSTLDFPFCVCWANENWSRRWDGRDQDLLMTQQYSDEDDINFIKNISKYLKDPRYICIDGKPLLMIYRPSLFPNIKDTVNRWRNWCKKEGIGEIYLIYPMSFDTSDPSDYGFDAACEFPPNNSNPPKITNKVNGKVVDFNSTIYDWRIFLDRSDNYSIPPFKLFRAITPSWDNTARKKNNGTIFLNNSPSLFEKWAINAFRDTITRHKNSDEQLVFVNAWNEWAEGAHLEPDQKYGYAWLKAISNAHEAALKERKHIVIVSHDAHPHGAQILCLNFARFFKNYFNFEVDLIVLGEGRLINSYAKYGNVHQINLDNDEPEKIIYLLESLRKKGADVAIANTTVSGKLLPQLKEAGFDVVSLIHELPGILNSYKLQEHAKNITELADKVIFPAQQVKDGFENFVGENLLKGVVRPQGLYSRSLIHEGAKKDDIATKVRFDLGIPHDAKLIMCAGYADYRKGFDLFVNASLNVMSVVPNTYAIWVGHTDEAFVNKSLEIAAKANLQDRFILTGLVDDPRLYYLAADVYALTSREDPFPSVVLEALDALTPVVAFSGCGGFENLLMRDCGILVPNTDTFALSKAIVSLLINKELNFSLGKRGQEIIAEEFSFYHYLFDLLEFAGHPLKKVSVIVPNYNYVKYLESRMDSIANQTYPVYELIVLDDFSSDDSVNEIKKYLSSTVIPNKLLLNSKNSGSVSSQWEKGVHAAKGEIIWIAEADDLAYPEFIEKLINYFNDKQVVLAYCQSAQIDENNNLLANNYLEYTNDVGNFWTEDYLVDGEDEIKRALCIKNTIPNVSGVLFEIENLKKTLALVKDSIKDYKVGGDWLIYLNLANLGKIAFKSLSLNLHRRHTSSVTKKNDHLDEVIKLQKIASHFVEIESKQIKIREEYLLKLKEYFSSGKIN
jgi:glycosyltransferase involved in cell wall biosynthesis